MKTIIAHPFDRPVCYFDDPDELSKFFKRNHDEPLDLDLKEVYGFVDKLKHPKSLKYKVILFINTEELKKKSKIYRLATVTHECVHAAIAVLSIAGVPISEENEESLAYLTDYIFQHALKIYNFD